MSADKSSDTVDCAKKFGWKEIPFEPIGVETGKYPIVRASDFDELKQKALECRSDKKVNTCLVRAPQGAGKTALSKEVKNDFVRDTAAFVISNSLVNMKPSDLAKQVIDQASKSKYVENSFFKKINYDLSKEYSSTEWKDLVIKVFDECIKDKTLGIWIIDEFDTISSSEIESTQEKTDFLQWIRTVIDGIANSDTMKSKKGFLIMMAHTEKSSEEFGSVLKRMHGPAHERIIGTGTIDIGYKYEEVKEIIRSRLSWAADTKKSTLEPFTENAIKTLYDLVNQIMGTKEMISFRLFEKTCFVAIKEACRQGLDVIDPSLIESSLAKISKDLLPEEEKFNVSDTTKQAIFTVLRSDLNVHIITVLKGILRGISHFMDNTLDEVKGHTNYVKTTTSGLVITEMKLHVTSKLKNKSEISVIWYCIGKDKESFLEKDFEEIETELKYLFNKRFGTNLVLLSLIVDKEIGQLIESTVRTIIQSADDIFLINKNLKKDLISLACAKDEELDQVRGSFDQNIKPKFEDLIFKSVNDITFKPSSTIISLIQVLNLLRLIGKDATGPALRDRTREFLNMGTTPRQADEEKMKDLGFATEETGNLLPTIPKALQALKSMLDDKKTIQDIQHGLGNADKVFFAAQQLGILDKDNKIVNFDTFKESLKTQIEESRSILKTHGPMDAPVLEDLEQLCTGYEKIEDVTSQITKLMIIDFIAKTLPSKLKEAKESPISRSSSASVLAPTSSVPAPPSSVPVPTSGLSSDTTSVPSSIKPLDLEQMIADAKDILSENPLTLKELANKMISMGYPNKVRLHLEFIIRDGKIKLTI